MRHPRNEDDTKPGEVSEGWPPLTSSQLRALAKLTPEWQDRDSALLCVHGGSLSVLERLGLAEALVTRRSSPKVISGMKLWVDRYWRLTARGVAVKETKP